MPTLLLTEIAAACRRRPAVAAMTAVALMLVVPALLIPFNTKGEPREAIVAMSMLMSGDWVLPVSFGADIPYKPPFLAWMVALLSLPAGHVSEFTARLPSIMACMALAATVVSFVRRDMGWSAGRALAAALVTVTTVEVWRTAGVCRVDMVLTAAVTGAIVALYRLALHGGMSRWLLATLLMTVAVLTKGPVGMVLPCLVTAIWAMTARLGTRAFWRLAAIVALAALASLVVPAWWYAAAYERGGEPFAALAIEENFGRMTGTMSYASHENPWWYNLQTLAAGLLPYTLLPLLALGSLRILRHSVAGRHMGRASRLALCAAIVTLVFYTVPASKRSVYLLPMYPFIAPGLVWLWERLAMLRPRVARAYCSVIRWVGVAVAIALVAAPFQPWATGMSPWICLPCGAVTGAAAWLLYRHAAPVAATLAVTLVIYTSIGLVILPPVMEARTDRDLAEAVEAAAGPDEPVWQLITQDPMLRYYTAGFYLGDRITQLPATLPASGGWLLMTPDDLPTVAASYRGATLVPVWAKKRSCDTRRPVTLYRLTVTNP